MNPDQLLADLQTRGIRLTVAGDRLRVDTPSGALTPELRDRLVQHKADILATLRQNSLCEVPPHSLPANTRPNPGTIIERWPIEAEVGCGTCKRCKGPITWGQVIEDTTDSKMRPFWLPLDPDLMPHGCGGPNAGRVVANGNKTTEKAQPDPSGCRQDEAGYGSIITPVAGSVGVREAE